MKKIARSGLFIFIISLCLYLPKLGAESQLLLPDLQPTISMDFQDANLKDILKVFSIQSGMNFIASEAVQDRKVTLYLDKVSLEEAMKKLFEANNLSYSLDKDSNILIVKDLGKPSVETITRVFYLKYATVSSSSLKEEMARNKKGTAVTASGAQETGGGGTTTGGGSGKWAVESDVGLTKAVQKLLSDDGSVIEDYRTNSLIVTDTPRRMKVIAQVIASLDVPIPQVMLEVEILDVSKNTVDSLGIKFPSSLLQLDMTTVARATAFPFSSNYNKSFTPQDWTMSRSGTTAGGWTVSSWPAAHFGPSIFSVINTQLVLNYLRTQTDTKFLARPRILTLNNETAEVKITTNEAIGVQTSTSSAEGSATQTEQAERSETGVSLRVTPQINVETGEITMFVVPTVAEAVTGGTFTVSGSRSITFKDPETRSTKSTVKVKDGETIVLGGMIRQDRTETITKLPILGDIPILGALFRHKDKPKDKERELLVFITPHIIKDSYINLAQTTKKALLPEREQSTVSLLSRELEINNSLNNFEKKNR